MKSRDEFYERFPELGITTLVEVGVFSGRNLKAMLAQTCVTRAVAVDPWTAYHFVASQATMDKLYQRVVQLSLEDRRVEVLRLSSEQAAARLAGQVFDLVYIDADHRYEAIAQDIRLWWPLVRSGGFLGGHDYFDSERWQVDVKRAVDEWLIETGQELFAVTAERPAPSKGGGPSWFVRKI